MSSVRELLESSDGQPFVVEFRKKNGEHRVMNKAQLGVTEFLRGGVSTVKHLPHLLTVFDWEKMDYRNVNCDTVTRAVVNGQEYIFTKEQ